jgi:hypothetical protein
MQLQSLIINLVVMTMRHYPRWLKNIHTQKLKSMSGQGEKFPKVQITFSYWKLGILKSLDSL